MSAQPKPEVVKPLFHINNSPHVRDNDSTSKIMFSVCAALAPSLIWGLLVMGAHALVPIVASVAACVITESCIISWRGKRSTIRDGSAVVTGLLLAAVSPPNLPWWAAALGGIFAMAIAKHPFGGLGHNIWNPALLARAFMQISMPDKMMSGEWPFTKAIGDVGTWLAGAFEPLNAAIKSGVVDAQTGATMMARMQVSGMDAVTGATSASVPPPMAFTSADIWRTWLGFEGGCIGEVSAILLLVGGLYLLWRKIITWEIPVMYLGSVAILGFVLPHPYLAQGSWMYTGWFQGPWLMHLGGGGVMLGAFFMATDMVTRPITRTGRMIFGLGCGVMTIIIRLFAGYPEGVCYSILFMNTMVPLIDNICRPTKFGAPKPAADKK